MERVEQKQELQLQKPFGTWLPAQVDGGDWIDGLAAAARTDPASPKRRSVEDVRGQMMLRGADRDAFEALDDAELDWLSC